MLVKEKRIEYQRGLEEYIEEQKLYELFEGMMKGLIIDKPQDPINYLIEKLQAQESKLSAAVTEFEFSPPNCAGRSARKQAQGNCPHAGRRAL